MVSQLQSKATTSQDNSNIFFFIITIMGVNYGDTRPRMESLGITDEVILASIGTYDYNYEKFSITEEVADRTNRQLDKVQERYNKRFNFPPP